MSYYYMREYGPEGAVITGEGQAPGTELTTLMGGARPPFRTAMEIGAALADILTIAAEDRQVHGDIKPGTIRVDASGTVILDGFGIPRRTCRAPEGKPIGPESDVYCLGISVHSLLSDNSMGALPRDADAHDGEVLQKIMGMDFSEVADRKWVQDVQKFLTLCMAWDPAERPAALDVANVLGYVAESCPGQDLRTWSARRVLQAPAPAPVPAREAEEDLGGPTTSQGPVAAGLFKARVAPAAKGESTSFWSREKIQAMLAEEDEPDAPAHAAAAQRLPAPAPLRGPPPPAPYGVPAPPPPMPPPASPYAPPRPAQSAPPPPATRHAPPPPAAPFAPPPAMKPHAPPPPAAPYAPPASPFAPPPAREPLPPARHTPMGAPPQAQASPFVVAGPVADPSAWGLQGGQSASSSAAPAEKPKKKSKILWIIIAVVLLLVVLPCAGFFTMGALGVFSWSSLPGMGSSKVEPTTPSSVEVASPTPDTPPGEPTTPAEPVTSPEPAEVASATETPAPPKTSPPASPAPPPTDRGASTATTTTSPKTTPTSTTSTTTAPKSSTSSKGGSTSTTTGAPFEAKIMIQGGEGKIICGDGQRRSFVGTTRMSFTSVVTCRLESATGRSALQISGPSSYACTSAPSGLTCSKE